MIEDSYELAMAEETLISLQVLLSISNSLDYWNNLSYRHSLMLFFFFGFASGHKVNL